MAGPDAEVTIASLLRLIELNFTGPTFLWHKKILRKAVEGYTVREIAGQLGLSKSGAGRILKEAVALARN